MNTKYYAALRNYCTRYGIDWRFDTIQNPITLIWEVLRVVNALTKDMDEMKELITQELQNLINELVEDGTLEEIINVELLSQKLDVSEFEKIQIIIDESNFADIQSIIDENPDATLKFKKGNYTINESIIMKNNSLIGEDGVVFINNLNEVYGTEKALITYGTDQAGLPSNRFNIGVVASNTANTITLPSTDGVVVGDVVATDSTIGVVVSKTETEITLDRKIYHTQSGKNLWKILEFRSVIIKDIEFDLNNKYGFGLKVVGKKAHIENIVGKNVGSRVIELKESVDSVVERCTFTKAFDQTSGHGYGLRITYTDNTMISQIHGYDLRHTVDVNKAYNTMVCNSKGVNNITPFMTHDSGSLYTTFENNTAINSSTGAYGGLDTGGDLWSTIKGGYVEGSFINANHLFRKETKIEGVVFKNTALQVQGDIVFENCQFNQDASTTVALVRLTNDAKVKMINCVIDLDTSRELYYTSAGTNSLDILNSSVNVKNMTTAGSGHSGFTLSMVGCVIDVSNKSNTSPTFNTTGKTIFTGNTVNGSVSNIIGGETGSTLVIHSNTFIDVVKVYFARSGVNVRIGQNALINSYYVEFTNSLMKPIGVFETDTITGGTWDDGSTVIHAGALKTRKASAWVTL